MLATAVALFELYELLAFFSLRCMATASAAASAAAMVRDLQNMRGFVDVQVGGGRDRTVVVQCQLEALKMRFQHRDCSLTTGQATELGEAVNAGPWDDNQKSELHEIIDRLLAKSAAAGCKRRQMQRLSRFENWQTAPEWKSIRSKQVTLQAIIAQVASRMWSLGLTCPSEKDTTLRAAIIIASCQGDTSTAKVSDIFNSLKVSIKANDEARRYPYQHLADYPESPLDRSGGFTKEMYDYAYPDSDDPPVEVSIMFGPGNREPGIRENSQKCF